MAETILTEALGLFRESALNIVFGILIFLFGLVLGKILGRVIYWMLNEVEINELVRKSTGLKINADHIISSFVSYLLYFLAFVAALDQIGITNFILYLLSATIIAVLVISFFFSIRDFIPNFVSGIYLYGKDNFKEGNTVEVGDLKGELVHIDLLHVKIKTKSGDIIYIPNSVAANSKIKVIKKPNRETQA